MSATPRRKSSRNRIPSLRLRESQESEQLQQSHQSRPRGRGRGGRGGRGAGSRGGRGGLVVSSALAPEVSQTKLVKMKMMTKRALKSQQTKVTLLLRPS